MIQWGLANQNGYQNALAQGMAFGQQIKRDREEKEYRNALASYDPNNPDSAKALRAVDPRLERQLAHDARMEKVATAEAEDRRRESALAQIPVTIRMLQAAKANPESYPSILAKAQELGIAGAESAPAQFDPQWIDQTISGLTPFATPQGREILSTAGKQAYDEGLNPGTPEYAARVNQLVNAGFEKTVSLQPGGTGATVNTMTGEASVFAGPGATGGPAPVQIRSIEDARGLPPGTQFVDPNGVLRVVPGGTSSNAGGGF